MNCREHALHCNELKYQFFTKGMMKEGIRLSSIGRVHMASTHTEQDIEDTLKATYLVLNKLK